MVELINTSSDNSLAIDMIYLNYIKLILLRKERLMLEKKLVRSRNKLIQFYKISRVVVTLPLTLLFSKNRLHNEVWGCEKTLPSVCLQYFQLRNNSPKRALINEIIEKKPAKNSGIDMRNCAFWHNNLIYVATSCEVSSKVYVNKGVLKCFSQEKWIPTLHNEHKTYLGEDEFVFNGRRLTYSLVSLTAGK